MKLQPELVFRLSFLITIVFFSTIGFPAGFTHPEQLSEYSFQANKEESIVVLNMDDTENERFILILKRDVSKVYIASFQILKNNFMIPAFRTFLRQQPSK
jgi:hypothetical protein